MGPELPMQAESLEDSLEPDNIGNVDDLVHPSSHINSEPELAEPPAKKNKN